MLPVRTGLCGLTLLTGLWGVLHRRSPKARDRRHPHLGKEKSSRPWPPASCARRCSVPGFRAVPECGRSRVVASHPSLERSEGWGTLTLLAVQGWNPPPGAAMRSTPKRTEPLLQRRGCCWRDTVRTESTEPQKPRAPMRPNPLSAFALWPWRPNALCQASSQFGAGASAQGRWDPGALHPAQLIEPLAKFRL